MRTKCLTAEEAAKQATMRMGDPRWTDVAIYTSKRAHAPKNCYVAWNPTSEKRRAEILQQKQDERSLRALREGPHYAWVMDATEDGRRTWLRCKTLSGETYEVTPETCTCPDWTDQCQGLGLRCKHIEAIPFAWSRAPREWETFPSRRADLEEAA